VFSVKVNLTKITGYIEKQNLKAVRAGSGSKNCCKFEAGDDVT
jgi:hypothetical protein